MKKPQNWIIEGLMAGVVFLIIILLVEYISGDYSSEGIWTKVVVYLVAGLGYGLTMKLYRRKKSSNN